MDAALLTDPAFWEGAEPFAAGRFPGDLRGVPGLEGHVLFETSGSSGTPKWIALSKDALLISAAAVNRHLGVTEASRWGLALPLNHVGGFGVVARAYEAACALSQFKARWDAATFSRWMEEKRITHASLVPTQVHDLVAAGISAPAGITAIVVGGGRLDEPTGRAARALGWPVLASYGMTEAGSQIATQALELLDMPYEPAPLPLLPIWDARIGRDGLLEIAGPCLFSGSVVQGGGGWEFAPRGEPWFVTSDRAILADGGLTPLGRADLRVKVLGELVDPEEIERELAELGGPAGSFAVAAVPDERAGHRLVPVVEEGVDRAVLARALERHRGQVPGFRRLGDPVFVSSLPRTPLGKIRRGALDDLAGGRL